MNIQEVDVSRGTNDAVKKLYEAHKPKLEAYADQLLWWNKRVNLISRSIGRQELLLHIEHCLYPIALNLLDDSPLIDTGTGGGLPGIPLAIARPQLPVLLNDIVKKKLLAAQQISRKLNLDCVDISHEDLRNVSVENRHTLVTKHAFKLPNLLNFISGKPIQKLIIYKGEDWKSEVETISSDLKFEGRAFKLDTHQSKPFYQGKVILELNLSSEHEQR
jgi:16S rRNA (guanine527-N7)-methyltransferase